MLRTLGPAVTDFVSRAEASLERQPATPRAALLGTLDQVLRLLQQPLPGPSPQPSQPQPRQQQQPPTGAER